MVISVVRKTKTIKNWIVIWNKSDIKNRLSHEKR